MTKQQLRDLKKRGYSALVRHRATRFFTAVRGRPETVIATACTVPLLEDDFIMITDAIDNFDDDWLHGLCYIEWGGKSEPRPVGAPMRSE